MIHYLTGDATCPIKDSALICHIVNDEGAWGAGFVLAVSNKWSSPERAYRDWHRGRPDRIIQIKSDKDFTLGNVQFVPVSVIPGKEIWVANMIAQKGYHKHGGGDTTQTFLQYDRLNVALIKVFAFAKNNGLALHMPRIGCGLAGGKWEKIEPLLDTHSHDSGIDVYVYDFKP